MATVNDLPAEPILATGANSGRVLRSELRRTQGLLLVAERNITALDGRVTAVEAALEAEPDTVDHGATTGRGDDDHTQYALLAGRATGQTLIGGIASGEDLTLQSTSHGTKGQIKLGAAGASLYDEATNRLGIGTATPSAALSVKAGNSTDHANVGGTVSVVTGSAANVGSGEDDLLSCTIPANTLGADGDSLYFEAGGIFAANNNSKQVRVRLGTGGTSIAFNGGSSANNSGMWRVAGRIIRTGAGAQLAVSEWNRSANGTVDVMAQDETTALTLKVTGSATADGDIVCQALFVKWEPGNS